MSLLHVTLSAALGAGALTGAAFGVQESSIRLEGSRPAALIESFGGAENYGQALLETVVNIDAQAYGDCPTGLALSGADHFELRITDQTLAQLAGPDGRAFHEVILTEGCGDPRLNNVYVFVKADGTNQLFPSFPGQSLASLQVQIQAYNQTSPIASESIVELFDSCAKDGVVPPAVVRDMELSAEPAPTREAWTEVWTYYQCERFIPVILNFTRGEDGIGLDAFVPKDFDGGAASAVSE